MKSKKLAEFKRHYLESLPSLIRAEVEAVCKELETAWDATKLCKDCRRMAEVSLKTQK